MTVFLPPFPIHSWWPSDIKPCDIKPFSRPYSKVTEFIWICKLSALLEQNLISSLIYRCMLISPGFTHLLTPVSSIYWFCGVSLGNSQRDSWVLQFLRLLIRSILSPFPCLSPGQSCGEAENSGALDHAQAEVLDTFLKSISYPLTGCPMVVSAAFKGLTSGIKLGNIWHRSQPINYLTSRGEGGSAPRLVPLEVAFLTIRTVLVTQNSAACISCSSSTWKSGRRLGSVGNSPESYMNTAQKEETVWNGCPSFLLSPSTRAMQVQERPGWWFWEF